MKISQQGIDLLTQREGKRSVVYLCSQGYPTVGVGHMDPALKVGEIWTNTQIEDALRADLERFERAVNDSVTVGLEQFQFDALVSFAFNVGVGAFKTSTLVRKINLQQFEAAAAQFDRWHIPPEITSRRNAERDQFKGEAFEARIA